MKKIKEIGKALLIAALVVSSAQMVAMEQKLRPYYDEKGLKKQLLGDVEFLEEQLKIARYKASLFDEKPSKLEAAFGVRPSMSIKEKGKAIEQTYQTATAYYGDAVLAFQGIKFGMEVVHSLSSSIKLFNPRAAKNAKASFGSSFFSGQPKSMTDLGTNLILGMVNNPMSTFYTAQRFVQYASSFYNWISGNNERAAKETAVLNKQWKQEIINEYLENEEQKAAEEKTTEEAG